MKKIVSHGFVSCGILMLTSVSMIFALAFPASAHVVNIANDDESPEAVPASSVAATENSASGPSSDIAAIVSAANQQNPNIPSSTVTLVDAVSTQEVIPIRRSDSNAGDSNRANAQTDTDTVIVSSNGSVRMSGPSDMLVSVTVPNVQKNAQLVNGALVGNDAIDSTSVVTSATENGLQTAVVLANASASNRIPFSYGLPEGSALSLQKDGSVMVKAPVAPDKGQTIPTQSLEVVANIAKPWATDAHGRAVSTHYEISGTDVVQVVDTNANTAYPVVADPNWNWLWRGMKWIGRGVKVLAKKVAPGALVLCAVGAGWAWYRSDAQGWVRVGDAVVGCLV